MKRFMLLIGCVVLATAVMGVEPASAYVHDEEGYVCHLSVYDHGNPRFAITLYTHPDCAGTYIDTIKTYEENYWDDWEFNTNAKYMYERFVESIRDDLPIRVRYEEHCFFTFCSYVALNWYFLDDRITFYYTN